MAATSQQSSQQLMSDWFQKAAEMTEAAMMATARMQLATLDRFMESMTGTRSMLESAQPEPQQWLSSFGEQPEEGKERERKATGERSQSRGPGSGHKKPAAKGKTRAKRSPSHKRG